MKTVVPLVASPNDIVAADAADVADADSGGGGAGDGGGSSSSDRNAERCCPETTPIVVDEGKQETNKNTPEQRGNHDNGDARLSHQEDYGDVEADHSDPLAESVRPSSRLLTETPQHRMSPEPKRSLSVHRVPVFGRWAVLVSVFVSFGLSIGLPVSLASIFLEWQATFETTRARAVAVCSIGVGILFAAALIPGYLMDRFGPRFVVVAGSSLSACGFFISMFAVDINFLTLSAGVMAGMGFCMVQLPTFPCLTLCFTRYKTFVMAIVSIGSGLANALLPYFMDYLVHQYSWRGAFAILSGVALQMLPFGLVMTSFQVTSKSVQSQPILLETFTNNPREEDVAPDDASSMQISSHEYSVTPDVVYSSDLMTSHTSKGNEHSPGKLEFTHARTKEVPDDDNEVINNSSAIKKNRLKLFVESVRRSKWRFLLDPLFDVFLVQISLGSASLVSFIIIVVDFSRTIGYTETQTGIFFFLIIAIFTFFGRAVVCALSLIPKATSFGIYCGIALLGNASIFLLAGVRDYTALVCLLAVVGTGVGNLVVLIPRCTLAVDSVTLESYPLAYSLACTMEGVFDCLIPIFIAFVVDKTGSYDIPLRLVGGSGMTISILLAVVSWWTQHKKGNGQTTQEQTNDTPNNSVNKTVNNSVNNTVNNSVNNTVNDQTQNKLLS